MIDLAEINITAQYIVRDDTMALSLHGEGEILLHQNLCLQGNIMPPSNHAQDWGGGEADTRTNAIFTQNQGQGKFIRMLS